MPVKPIGIRTKQVRVSPRIQFCSLSFVPLGRLFTDTQTPSPGGCHFDVGGSRGIAVRGLTVFEKKARQEGFSNDFAALLLHRGLKLTTYP